MATQHVSEPTHKCGGVLDFVLTTGGSSYIVQNRQICADDYSVHFPNIADLTIRAEKVPMRIHVQTRKFTPDTVRVPNGFIGNSAEMNKINSCSDVNDAVTLYNNSAKSTVLTVALVLSETITARPRQRWYNEELGDLKRAKRKAERKWLSQKTSTNKEA